MDQIAAGLRLPAAATGLQHYLQYLDERDLDGRAVRLGPAPIANSSSADRREGAVARMVKRAQRNCADGQTRTAEWWVL
jgi:hypothetical protein